MIRVRYFAWLREAVGLAEEEIDLPPHIVTAGEFRNFIAERHSGLAKHVQSASTRLVIDLEFAREETPLGAAREIALLPPMTGG